MDPLSGKSGAPHGETSELLVSELVTNAVQISRAATRGTAPPVRLWVVSDKAQVVILVWDAVLLPPVPQDAAGDAETGRGLLLVEALSTRWGWHVPPGMGGKVVWAQVPGAGAPGISPGR